MKNIICIYGPTGSPKVELSQYICKKKNFCYISVGNLKVEAAGLGINPPTDLDIEIQYLYRDISLILTNKQDIPDEIVVWLIKRRILEDKNHQTFILDGFPLTIEQDDLLEEKFQCCNISIDIQTQNNYLAQRLKSSPEIVEKSSNLYKSKIQQLMNRYKLSNRYLSVNVRDSIEDEGNFCIEYISDISNVNAE